jgi:hypothetical protein
MTVRFDIRQIHDPVLRRDLERHRDGLIDHYGNALGGFHTLVPDKRSDVERAAHLMALAWMQRARSTGLSAKDDADLKRLEGIASDAVTKLGIPLR